MLRTGQSFLLLALIAVFAAHLSARELQQRRPRASSNIANGIDTLGMWQPESVRSILLLYSGKNLSKPKADELETDLRKTPDKIESRLVLIGYYSSNGKTSVDRLRLRTHVLWMVENHPEHPATSNP